MCVFGGGGEGEIVRQYLFVKPLAQSIILALTSIERTV